MKIAGLDIGTTGCKCTVFDETGCELDKAYCNYPIKRKTGSHEIDAKALLESVYLVIGKMSALYPDIAGIGVTSFGETFVMLDENDEPLAPAMLYTDPRGDKECRELVDKLGLRHIVGITGVTAHEMYGLPKIMWQKRNNPDIFKRVKRILQMEDYVVYSLTGNAIIDYSLATRFMAFDISTLDFSDELLSAAGIDKSLFSKPVPTGTNAGKIRPQVSQKLGLSKDCQIIAISQDQVAAAIGAGAFSPDIAVDGAGTVQCLTPVFDGIPDIDKMMPGKYVIVPYIFKDKYVTYAFSYTGGALIQWATDSLAKDEKFKAKEQGILVNEYLENEYNSKRIADLLDTDGPSGMLVLPHFAGAATPYMDTGSKGAIVGLTLDSSVAEIYRGCMEGVCYEMYINYRNVVAAGAKIKRLHATGGGAHSTTWMQMKADVLGVPISALSTVDSGTVGSAMMTGIALSCFSDIEDAANHMIKVKQIYEPRKHYHTEYMEVFSRYENLYNALRPLV